MSFYGVIFMLGRTKYDVMKSEEIKLSSSTMVYMLKLMSLINEEPTEETVMKLSEIINKVYPQIVVMSHIGYENAKDIFELDRNVLSNGLISMGDNEKSFEYSYSRIIERYTKNIVISMIIEEEEIDTTNLDYFEPLFNILGTRSCYEQIRSLIDSSVVTNPDNVELLLSLSSPSFGVMDMNSKQIQRINNYHQKFMEERIYPKVTSDKLESEKVLKLAHRISKIK